GCGEAQPLAVRGPGEAVAWLHRGGHYVGRVRAIEDDHLGPSKFGVVEKREPLSIRGPPQVGDVACAFPDLGPKRAFNPHSPWSPPYDGELTRARPVGPGDLLGELARNSAHSWSPGKGSRREFGKEARGTHQESKA